MTTIKTRQHTEFLQVFDQNLNRMELISKILFFLNISLAFVSCSKVGGGRIVGGVAIDITAAPYQASLQYDGAHFCGGSIISNSWILTAGHCTEWIPLQSFTVRVGSTDRDSGGEVLRVEKIVNHPHFDAYMLDYDFALLKLEKEIVFGPTISPIPLISENEELAENLPALISGWGDTLKRNESSQFLRAVVINMVEFSVCEDIYRDYGGVSDRMLCAAGKSKDSCQG